MDRRDQDLSSGSGRFVVVVVGVSRHVLVHVESQWHGASAILSDRFRTVVVMALLCWISVR